MKTILVLCGVAAMLALAGCQSSPEHSSAAAMGGGYESGTSGQVSGHAESGIQNYRDILSSPGPFE